MKLLNIFSLFTSTFFILGSFNSMANINPQNKFSLVYDNAITENIEGQVNIHKVKYPNKGFTLVANIYTPKNYNPKNKYKAIVVAHPNGGVKEQVAGLYAQNLASLGYITIAFDSAYQGESSGMPRNTDLPSSRMEDIRAAADFIQTYPGVDPNTLGLVGICGGGGYSLSVAATDKRFDAIATIAMFNTGRVRRNGYMDSQLDSIQERLKEASKARQEFNLLGKIEYVPAPDPNMSNDDIDKIPNDLYREGMYYYLKNYSHQYSSFAYTKASLLELMNFDATDHIDLINKPLLLITGSKADSKYMTDEAFLKATGTKNKEEFVVNNATHIQMYYVPEYVKIITNKLELFFNRNL